jgi:hypothetical protein
MPNARQEDKLDSIAVLTKPLPISLCHRSPDNPVRRPLREENGKVWRERPRRICLQELLPGLAIREVVDAQRALFERVGRTASRENVKPSFDTQLCETIDHRFGLRRDDIRHRGAVDRRP